MVAANLYGGLGNQMFQQAAAIGYAKEHKKPFFMNHIDPKLRTIEVKETGHAYNYIPNITKNVNILLDGYFQSEKYFTHAEAEVRKYFSAPTEVVKGVCSIHVRRGDYLLYPTKHPVVTLDYIDMAVGKMWNETKASKFLVFSDDIAWCKNNFRKYDSRVDIEFMNRSVSPYIDMMHMMKCEHNIIANSTYSWWGAWLNPNPDKIVISPSTENWFGPDNAHLEAKDIIPEKWIQIKY